MIRPLDISTQRFGELTAVKLVGRRPVGAERKLVPLWQVVCSNGHLDERTLRSLRTTDQKSICKVCGKRKHTK